MSKDKKTLKLFSKQVIKLQGDLDILVNFGFHIVPLNYYNEKGIPTDLINEYVNSE